VTTGIDTVPIFSVTSTDNNGAAYVFRRAATPSWGSYHYIKPLVTEAGDRFGASVAADGDTFVIGANGEDSGVVGNMNDNSASGAGAVYVFR